MNYVPFLNKFQERFEDVQSTKEPLRSKRLAVLMTDLEQTFQIPGLNNESFNRKNKAVMHLYKKVSMARDFQ